MISAFDKSFLFYKLCLMVVQVSCQREGNE